VTSSDAYSAASLFDPTRLRIARQAAMTRKKDLAEKIGVSAGAVSQYENGTTTPSPRVVAALALALGQPASFFAADRPLGEATATLAHFRSLRSTSKQERDRAFAHALLTWELAQVIQRYVRLPLLDLPTDLALGSDDPPAAVEAAARQARLSMGLDKGPVPNVVRLLESKGVVCTRLPAQTRRVFAFSCDFPERPVVVLSTERFHRAAGRFDAAHELAHILMHHDAEPGTHAVERQANVFASEFLAPASEIIDDLPVRADWKQLLHLKEVWGISIQALLYKARSLGVMPENTYRRAVTEINSRGWRKVEPGDDGRGEQPILLGKALDVIQERGISVEELSDLARLPVDTILQIVATDDRPVLAL
jgi:Zn-dependent peptidase ImmA (M78 family)/transcriptional regulator with XRE-family HTH domain